MAIEFKNGKSVIDKDAIPQWGSFVYPEKWEFIKHLKERLNRVGELSLTIQVIEDTFSPIVSPVTKFVHRTSVEQFKSFCEMEGIGFVVDYHRRTFIMRSLSRSGHEFKICK